MNNSANHIRDYWLKEAEKAEKQGDKERAEKCMEKALKAEEVQERLFGRGK